MTSDSGLKKFTLKNISGLLFTFGITAAFVYIAFRGIDLSRLLDDMKSVSLMWIAIYVFLNILAHYVRAVRWKVILNTIKPETSSINLFNSLMIGYGMNNFIPRLGEISRAVSLGYLEQISRTAVLGTIVVERILDIILFGAAVLISLIIYNGNIAVTFPWINSLLITGSLFIGSFIAVIFFLARYKETYIKKIFPGKLGIRITELFVKLITGLSSLRGTKNYIYTAITSVAIMGLYALTSYAGFYAMDLTIDGNNFYMAWVVMSIGAIGVMIPTPGGIGSYHTITKSILVLLYGIDPVKALAYATLTHAISFIIQIILAVAAFIHIGHRDKSFKFSNLLSANMNNSQ